MKLTLLSLYAVLLSSPLLAQDVDSAGHNFHDEIGLNFTRFLDEAIDFGGENTLLSPYLFTYQRLSERGNGFRLGAGLNLSRSKGDLTGNFFDDDAKFFQFGLDLRLGNQHVRPISRRWNYYYGFDGLLGFSTLNISTNDSEITNQTLYGGLGPVMGAQFMLTGRLGLFTEASFYLVQSFVSEKSKFDSTLEEDQNEEANATRLGFQVPTNLYLFFKF
jgi:hypothetical protein